MKELQKGFETNGEKQRQKFLKHLYEILDNPKNYQIIGWDEHRFVIWNVEEFKKQLLTSNFKHNNYQSLMRQLNKYGFKIKSKENLKAYFSHPTIRENNREKKRVLQIKKKLEKIDYEKELNVLKGQLEDLKKGQKILNKQFQISIKIMMKLQSHYARLNIVLLLLLLLIMTLYTVGFANIIGNLSYTNHKTIWGNIGGDLFQVFKFYLK
ncbi:unnamed protein product (macronuclear) [Paramecium tetraurelia]|uniref:HSF-type DNA-binding domain-containing protein n=1 Tax=Paramecium tetraurelia TaxID=5888 RepID=A0C3S8_PARTE|nr:uncharacterized protein GSPATT00034924001 [Paramecium tetraurelia]CAK65445.1 unnamed protein product [Paramecium tetraurelia]|eukprot:XP_001432842.1 hypothetical protein (macronuclear) [Paramecium tetraurelia strain d4-2]